MKRIIPIILFAVFLFVQPGCKDVVDDVIDCTIESLLLSVKFDIDTTNTKVVHFEFVNDDTDGDFTLDGTINWDFGDGSTGTSTDNKIDHTYSTTGDFAFKAAYTLRRGSASCNGTKDKTVTIE